MAAFLGNLRNVVIASFVLAILLVGVYCITQGFDGPAFELFVLRWLHIVCGVMWIGLLWYFNFVATPTMPKIPDELKPALGRYITPAALFWFRWGAMGTIFFGIVLTMGMAVDANVLIYERIREEQRNGRSMLASIDQGFRRAMATIIDANSTHLIAALILFQLGSGPVRGFAVTLGVGIVTSFFTAVMVTRLIVVYWLAIRRPKRLAI